MMLMSPYILQLMSGLGGRMRPVFNVTISNVPGPTEELYYEGAKLDAMYPVSLITHGGALNITCLSYAGSLNFGFTGCRDTLPSMQKLAVYTGEALEELRNLLLPQKKPTRRKPAVRKTPAAKKTDAGAKAAPVLKPKAKSKAPKSKAPEKSDSS
jgi:hypothetical protein